MGGPASLYMYPHGSAPFVIVDININREVEKSDGVQKRGGNMEGTWQEHDGTDDHIVSNTVLFLKNCPAKKK